MRTRATHTKTWLFATFLAALMIAAGCKRPEPTAPAPPPPPPPAPTASITANPSSVNRGESARLTWRTENATEVSIDGIGAVDPSGSRDVQPTDSTTYQLTAKGPGGTQDATTRVTVTVPPPPPVQEQEPTVTDEQWLAQNVRDVLFDYDSSAIRADQQATIAANARALNQKPNLRFTIEGHADERGSTEYNLTLGDERANSVKNALVAAGVNAGRINVISYGKERPQCTESNESCWQQNRRGHFTLR